MNNRPGPVSEQSVTLVMDYGQFCVSGGLGDIDAELELLEQALATQPCAGDGNSFVVLSPHQNNFEMPVAVEVWDTRPPADREEWQQVCEGKLHVSSDGQVVLTSPTDTFTSCEVPGGDYLVEVSGRGFVNYGWPGTTTPDDVWRIRLWPDDGADPRPPQQWNMPGYGVPESSPPHETSAEQKQHDADPEWITVFEPGGGRLVRTSELRAQADEAAREAWGGFDPIEQVLEYTGGKALAEYDRALVLAVVELDDERLRQVARWCVAQAFHYAGLADRSWVATALTALDAGDRLPPPFATPETAAAHLHADRSHHNPGDGNSLEVTASYSRGRLDPFNCGPIDRPSFALTTIFAALDPDPKKAAFETLYHASVTFQRDARQLHVQLRETFGLPYATA
ncbi:hypothetical protein [Rhodococcus wratislaviensis]|uniref:Uncharacterized protein n=1 Tax=Rhodococcus wratislaviensis NBRC 100605 TaxID=1219028 RepID=X0PMK9_RHOWR|nr:hypothetical protein [Rhodococcus wratislaviensis]GAF43703.1 hypothetical protein RW1_009_01270 [Rhodococcus wratislaviensis NBRC 100605]